MLGLPPFGQNYAGACPPAVDALRSAQCRESATVTGSRGLMGWLCTEDGYALCSLCSWSRVSLGTAEITAKIAKVPQRSYINLKVLFMISLDRVQVIGQ